MFFPLFLSWLPLVNHDRNWFKLTVLPVRFAYLCFLVLGPDSYISDAGLLITSCRNGTLNADQALRNNFLKKILGGKADFSSKFGVSTLICLNGTLERVHFSFKSVPFGIESPRVLIPNLALVETKRITVHI
jgi:hypothetical protein